MARRTPPRSPGLREAPIPYVAFGGGVTAGSDSTGDLRIRTELVALAETIRVAKGARIFRERERRDFVYAIVGGAAKKFHTLPNDVERITAFRYAGDYLGLADRERHSQSAMAIADTTLLKIPVGALDALVARSVSVAAHLLNKACADLREAEQHIVILGRGDAKGKIALFIAMLEQTQRPRGRAPSQIHLPMSRSDVADYVGLSPEALSRAFSDLGQAGILTYKGKRHLTVAARPRFRALIDG